MAAKVVFFGSTELSARCLEAILGDSGFAVAAAVCQPDNPKAKKRSFGPVKQLALRRGVPCLQPERVRDVSGDLSRTGATLGVCVAYGQFIPEAIRDLFSLGIVNVHPSLLPKYRGGAPVQHAIWNGDRETGITIIKLVKQMDAGPYCFQSSFPIDPEWTGGDLMDEVTRLAPPILIDSMRKVTSGAATWIPQDETLKTLAPVLTREQEKIDWRQPSAKVVRHIKAFSPAPATYATLDPDSPIKFFNARIGDHAFGTAPGTINLVDRQFFCVQAGDRQGCVHVLEFLLPGKKRTLAANHTGRYPFRAKDRFL